MSAPIHDEDWPVEPDEFGMHETRFRLRMEPYDERPPHPRPWGLALLLILLAAVFAGMIAYGVARIVGQVNG